MTPRSSLSGHIFCVDGTTAAIAVTVADHLTTVQVERVPDEPTRSIQSVSPEVAGFALKLIELLTSDV